MRIVRADLDSPDFAALLEEHCAAMQATAPPESQHALDLSGLRAPGVRVWTLHEGAALLGCGALQHLDADHAEIKSMRTARAHLRKGVARTMLRHLLAEACASGYRRVNLEPDRWPTSTRHASCTPRSASSNAHPSPITPKIPTARS